MTGEPDDAGPEEELLFSFEESDTGTITFGRGDKSNVQLDDTWVSPRHAEIVRQNEFLLVDLDSFAGVHHNGRRVVGRVRLTDGDFFAIGRHDFRFDRGRVYRSAHTDKDNPTLVEAYDLTVQVPATGPRRRGNRLTVLIDDVSFVVRRGTLLGVVGPSGSGKSTLLKAITGSQPATQGRLLVDKEDLYRAPGPHRGIGMVPQENIVHTQLSVERALRFAAALRCPRVMTRAQRRERVASVTNQLGLAKHLATPISFLSGGQVKRTSVAMELLTVPALLCLDEPTSGLDPALDRDIMGALRDLAKGEKTVIVSTHSPLHLDACDRVLVMSQGRMVYFGPPGTELLAFFDESEVYSDVFSTITKKPEVWAQRYRTSAVFARYVGHEQLRLLENEAASVTEDPTVPIRTAAPVAPRSRFTRRARPVAAPAATGADQPGPARQWLTLCLRMAMVILSDPRYVGLILGLPVALALLSHLIPGHKGLAPDPEGFSLEANRLLIVLVIGAAFMGIALPIREIVGERGIYRRERAVGLSPTAYLLSKMAVFTVIGCGQVALMVAGTLVLRGSPRAALVFGDATLEVTFAVALVATAATALGLLISSLVRTVEQTTPLLVFSVMAQLILSGALFQIAGQEPLEILGWFNPARWGYAAAAATTDFQRFPFTDPLWHHDAGTWWRSTIILCGQIVVLLAGARWALTRAEPGRG